MGGHLSWQAFVAAALAGSARRSQLAGSFTTC
jgi:hypothetical protein